MKICIAHLKGGTGKTTIACHLGWALSEKARVLMIDLNSQGLLSEVMFNRLLCDAQYIFDEKPFLKITPIHKNLGIVASNENLEKRVQKAEPLFILNLQRLLNDIDYDYVIIDCPPAHNMATLNGLIASDYVLIPVKPHESSLLSLELDMKFINTIRQYSYAKDLKLKGIIVNYMERTKHARAVVEKLKKEYPGLVLRTMISETVKIRDAMKARVPVWEYDSWRQEFRQLVNEIK